MLEVIALHKTYGKLLLEPMMTQSTHAYICEHSDPQLCYLMQ